MKAATCDLMQSMKTKVQIADDDRRSSLNPPEACSATPAVLVLSADKGVRNSLVLLLASAGFRAFGFGTVSAFIATACRWDDCCCLVIDHHVPGGTDGLGVLEQMVARKTLIPTIITNERVDAALHRRATAAGAIAVLNKPLLDDAILDAVSAAIGRRFKSPYSVATSGSSWTGAKPA